MEINNSRIKEIKYYLKKDMLNEDDISDLLKYINGLEQLAVAYFKIICDGGKK